MIDVESHMMALKGSWIARIYSQGNEIWKYLPSTYIKLTTDNLLLDMNFSSINQMPRLKMITPFYQEVIIGFSMSRNIEINDKTDLYSQIIWGNKNLMIDSKCLYSKSFIDSGFIYVYDILDANGKFKNNIYDNLINKHDYLRTIHMIQVALKPYKKERFCSEEVYQIKRNVSATFKMSCKHIYKGILKKKCKKSKAITKWSNFFHDEIIWSHVYANKLSKQYEPKLLDFNFKLLNNLLPTKSNLVKWKKTESQSCIYCDCPIHTITHMLWECPHLENVWQTVDTVLGMKLELRSILLGTDISLLNNRIVTLLCYLIFKKYLQDNAKETNNCTLLPIF